MTEYKFFTVYRETLKPGYTPLQSLFISAVHGKIEKELLKVLTRHQVRLCKSLKFNACYLEGNALRPVESPYLLSTTVIQHMGILDALVLAIVQVHVKGAFQRQESCRLFNGNFHNVSRFTLTKVLRRLEKTMVPALDGGTPQPLVRRNKKKSRGIYIEHAYCFEKDWERAKLVTPVARPPKAPSIWPLVSIPLPVKIEEPMTPVREPVATESLPSIERLHAEQSVHLPHNRNDIFSMTQEEIHPLGQHLSPEQAEELDHLEAICQEEREWVSRFESGFEDDDDDPLDSEEFGDEDEDEDEDLAQDDDDWDDFLIEGEEFGEGIDDFNAGKVPSAVGVAHQKTRPFESCPSCGRKTPKGRDYCPYCHYGTPSFGLTPEEIAFGTGA